MTGKPAARQGDPTHCPKKGHGSNTIVTGSPDVLIDGQPAARMGDTIACGSTLASQVVPNVLINGRPAAVLGSTGTHGDVVIGGSGTVVIGGAVVAASGEGGNSQLLAPGGAVPAQQLRQGAVGEALPFSVEEEEEEDEQELPLQQRITLRIGMFFDGTLNNMNNAAFTAECRRQDLNLFEPEELERIRVFCEENGYGEFSAEGRFEATPDNSYGNEASNVALLYDLYLDQADLTLGTHDTEASLAVYIDGIGSTAGQPDSLTGYAFGQGETGVVERVKQSPQLILKKFRELVDNNPQFLIERIQFDVFGFSRGAAAARHFANEVCAAGGGVLAPHFSSVLAVMVDEFEWSNHTSINFIGLFDTVAAIGDPAGGELSVGNAYNPGVNLHLAPDCANKVVHLTAADEHRHNFSLNRVNAAGSEVHEELVLPGVHSNLGGGYPAVTREKVLLGRPQLVRGDYYSLSGIDRFKLERSHAWRQREAEEARFRATGLPGNGRFIKQEIILPREYERRTGLGGSGDILLILAMDRFVRGDLSKVSATVMHAKAVLHNVPFKKIPSTLAFAIPEALGAIATKILAAAADRKSAVLSETEGRFLHGHYIHSSANWNAKWGLFPNKPRDGNERATYASQ
ncbi:MAG: PAAR domain-containing protein [Halopseudomonas sp.]|uniref:PAAR domain-containing protein n=1 Tax=Halopseudomonas sp. TaxID=2901191 RepID=UPI0030038F06